MSRTLRSLSLFNVLFLCIFAFSSFTSWAKEKEAPDYPLSGNVLATTPKGPHSYQIATDGRIYLMLCERVPGLFHMTPPECKVNDRPIVAGDTVQFRVDGDWAYMPVGKGANDGLRILTVEFKVIPPLPPAAAAESAKGSSSGAEHGMVIGTGVHILGQKKVGWSTNPSSVNGSVLSAGAGSPGIATATAAAPVMATGPVMAIPATGGAPVMVMPSGPTGGGVVTGVPVTGGAPVVGIATGPVMGVPVGGAAHPGGVVAGGGPVWVHILRVQAGRNIYLLECAAKACETGKKQIELGDTLAVRVEKKWAYVSSVPNSGEKEQRFKILGETEEEATPEIK